MAGTKISTMTALPNVNAVDSTFFPVVTAANENRKQTRRQNRRYLTTGTPVIGDVLRWSSNANAYNSAYTYERGDIVTSGGNLYVAVQQSSQSNAQAPGVIAYWTEIGLAAEIGDWVARPLTHKAPTGGQVPVWDTSLPIADWTATGTRWRVIDASRYTEAASRSSPSTTSAFEFSTDPATYGIRAGVPLRWEYPANTYYYGIVTIATSTLVTVSGPSIDLAQAIVSLAVGTPEMVHTERFVIPGSYGETENRTVAGGDPILKFNNQAYIWSRSKSYLVSFSATNFSASGNQGRITPVIVTDIVSTENTNTGPVLSSTSGTWVTNAAATIDKDKYDINYGEALEFDYNEHASGTTGETDLNIICVFVQE